MRPLVLDAQTGKEAPPVGGRVLLSSEQSPWRGMYLEQHAGGPIESLLVTPRKHLLIVQGDEPTVFECRIDGHSQTVHMAPGEVSLFPAFSPFTAQTKDTRNYLTVGLDPQFVLCAANAAVPPSGLVFKPRHGVEDPLTRGIALALKAEAEMGYPGGRCYGESLAHALSIHLVQQYANGRPATRSSGGLAPGQLRSVIQFIHDHLAEDLSLETLAAEASLSPFHFARCFKESTGVAPHKYLIQRRVERAKELLMTSGLSIAEAGLRVGFCDQSHLTRHFKRTYGVAPKAFLRQFVPRTKSR